MERFLKVFFSVIALIFIFNGVDAQAPAPGTVTFKYQTGTQTNSTSAYADFVPTSGLGQDGGYGYEFITQGTGTTSSKYVQVSYYMFNALTSDGMISFDRNSTSGTIQAAFIRSARAGAVTTQGETSKPVAGGEFKMQSLDLLAISGTPTVSVQAYANGVAIGSPQTAVINSTTKTTINLSANTNFSDVDEIGITGFNADGIRADNLISTTAVVNTGAPAFTYAGPQVYTVGTAITPLGPISTSGSVGAYGPFSTFANVNTPGGIDVDQYGNVYASDTNDDLVYIFNSTGVALPGSPRPGPAGDTPYGITVDGLGNTYVANGPAGTITRTTAGGIVSNIKGFTFPVDVVVDASNNVYITDLGNFSAGGGAVYKILAGTSTATRLLTGLNNPSGIAINSTGDIFIAQYPLNTIIKVAAGTTTQTPFVTTGLNSPYGLEFGPLGNLYLADEGSNTIKKVTPAGVLTTINGTGLSFPYDVDFDPSGNMYITNNGANTIQISLASGYSISPALPAGLNFNSYSGAISGTPTAPSPATIYTVTGTNTQGTNTATVSIAVNIAAPVTTYQSPQVYTAGVAINPLGPTNTGGAVGSYGAATTFASVNTPYGVDVDASNNVFVTDDADGDLYKYNAAGVGGTIYTSLNSPTGTMADGLGNVYVANFGNNTVCKFSASGTLLATITGFSGPCGINIDAANNVYVVNYSGNSITKIAAGTTTTSTFLSGFNVPYGIIMDYSGNVFISEMGTNSVIEVASGTTTHTTFATGFNGPRNLVIDNSGMIYVADFGNNAIKKITPAGIVTTVFSGLSSPHDVEFDVYGNLYIANTGTNAILKSVATGYAITSGTLPAGLYLNAYTGFITGTPTTVAAATNVTVTATNGTGSSSCVISIAVGGAVAWTGGNSTTAWATGGNWSTGTSPGQNDAVSIGVSAYTHAFEPSITAANVTVNSITFGNNGGSHSLTVTSPRTLTISGNLTVPTGATPTIAGAGAINIAPGGIINITGAGVLNTTLTGKLTLKSNATGSASIGQITSTSITGSGADSISVERYLTGGTGYRSYRLMSSPVYAATVSSNNVYSINYLRDHTFLTGTSGTTNGFDKAGNPTIYLFREDQTPLNTSFTDGNYWGISNIAPNSHATVNYSVTGGNPGTTSSFNIPVGNAVMFFFRGDRTTVSPYVTTTTPVASTVTATGTLNAGQVVVHDWYTPASANLGYTGTGTGTNANVRGFNLVGNPYASSIDWEQYNTTSTTTGIYANNVGNIVYEFNPATNNYDTYQVGGTYTNHGTRIIVSGEGFFVQTTSNSSPQLIFNESAKTAAQNTGLNLFMATKGDMASLDNAPIVQHLRLQLAKDSVNTDDIYIGFDAAASSRYVFNEDAPSKPGTGKVHLSSISSDNVALAINKLPLPNLIQATIRLKVNATADGLYKLNMAGIVAISPLFEIWLMDAYKNDSLDMRHNKTYAFNMALADSNSFGSKRFSLVIRQNPALGIHLLSFTAIKALNGAQIVWTTENEQNYTNFTVERSTDNGGTFNVLGGFVSSALGAYGFLDKGPAVTTDQYRLKLEDLNGNITYSGIVTLIYGNGNQTVANNICVYPNPASSVINLVINKNSGVPSVNLPALQTTSITPSLAIAPANSSPAYSIKIISITGSVIISATSSSPTWQNSIGNLAPGTYIIQVTNNKNNAVVGKSTFVKI